MGRLTLGLSAERQRFEADGFTNPSNNNPTPFDDDWHVDIYSASLEYELFTSSPFGIVLGCGRSWFDKERGGGENDSHFLAGAHYQIRKDLRIRGSFARKVRFPSIRQLYDVDAGNPDLNAERSYNCELGLVKSLGADTTVALTLFRMDVADYIEKIPPTDQFLNNDKYRFQGFELTAETRFIKNLLLRTGYSFLYTRDRSSQWARDELQYRPEHKFTFEGKYRFETGFSVYLGFMYVADQLDYSNEAIPVKRELSDYALFSVKLDQALFNDRLHLYLGADNLFDEDYEESFYFPQAGRVVYGGVEIRFW
jgi:outer membrane cobalamin receptor